MFRIAFACIVVVCLWVTLAQASPSYTYQTIDIQDPRDGNRLLTLRRATNDDQLLLRGQRLDWRATPDRVLTAVTCPADVFPRFVRALRQGPDVTTINNVGTVGGSDIGTGGVTWAFLQAADGTCTFFQGPGNARATYVTALGDAGGSAGYYIDPYGTPGNAARQWHGYRRSPDGTLTPVVYGPGASALFPSGLNLAGDIVWTGRLDIPDPCPAPDQCSGTYAAGWCDSNDVCAILTAPDGQPLTIVDLNNARQALAYSGTPGQGGRVWLIDLTATPASFAEPSPPPPTQGYSVQYILPQGLNDHGWIVGRYTQQQTEGQCERPGFCLRNVKQFLAIPTP